MTLMMRSAERASPDDAIASPGEPWGPTADLILRDAALVCAVRDGLAIARPARARAAPQD